MENKNELDLRFLQLRFIGKILAGFTHEIKNHLAIVKESAGLIGDIIKLGKSGKNESSQYLEIIHSIEEQIERATEHFRYLNRFSHRMDTSLATFNINESLEELIALLNRLANQKKIHLEKDFQKDLPSIYSNPSMLQFIVFGDLEEKITRLDKNSRIIVKTEVINGSVAIRIIPKGNALETDVEKVLYPHEINDYVIKMLGGTISKQKENGDTVITIPVSAT